MNTYPKVFFYTNISRFFRTTLIGYLYEICQKYPVILLSEELDEQTEQILKNKSLFPKLEKILPINQYATENMSRLTKHRHFSKLAKEIIDSNKPDIVIVTGYNIFEAYLRRFSREMKIVNISFMRFLFGKAKPSIKEYILRISYLKVPKFLPSWIKIIFSTIRLHFGHFLCFWISPLLIGQKPFIGEPSCIYIANNSRFKGVDYFIVLSKKDYKVLKEDGIPEEKIYILPHSLERNGKSKDFFKNIYFSYNYRKKQGQKIVAIFWPSELVVINKDFRLISREQLLKNRIETVSIIADILKDWEIIIKLHPTAEDAEEIKKIFKGISERIRVTEPSEPIDRYIEISDIIIGPSPASTSLFDAVLQKPEKPILSLDFYNEINGDSYKDFNGIEYINNKKEFVDILKNIKNNKYSKKKKPAFKKGKNKKEFLNAVEMIDYLIKQKQ